MMSLDICMIQLLTILTMNMRTLRQSLHAYHIQGSTTVSFATHAFWIPFPISVP